MTTTPLSKEELARIKELAESTPEGPWVWLPDALLTGKEALLWATEDRFGHLYIGAAEEVAEFIPCAREDMLKLVAEVERLNELMQDIGPREITQKVSSAHWPGCRWSS